MRGDLQLWTPVALGGVFVAYILSEDRGVPLWLGLLLGVMATGTIMWSFLKILDRLNKGASSRFEPIRNTILALSVEEAKRQAVQILANPNRFRSERASPEERSRHASALQQLAPEVRELVGGLSDAQPVNGDMVLGLKYLCPAFSDPDLIRIGKDIEAEVAVRPSDEQVLIIGPDGKSLESAESFPSIYHYILFNDALLQGVASR